jgi:hypothetical protein
MTDEQDQLLIEVQKLSPADGDVIAIKVPKTWDHREMWETLKEIREQGIQIVAFTDDVELTVIKDYHQYLLTVPYHLTEAQIERIKNEWGEYFPKAHLMVQAGGSTLVDVTPPDATDDISTL